MKSILLFITPLLILSVGCSSSKNTGSDENIQIIKAEYSHWSKPPGIGNDIPERGTDLSVTVKNWSSEYSPEYIIHNKRKSLSIAITDTVDGHPVITGRIIRASSKLAETSGTVQESDRLVYSDEQDNLQFVEIDEWTSRKE